MASPFQFFRKHQTGMMVVLVILAMLVFTLDALFTQQGANFWLLGLLLGGAVFGTAGIGSGRWLQWGIGGAVLGALMGLVMPELTKPPGVVATNFGIIEQEDMRDLIERRNVANGFMTLAREAAFGPFARQLPPVFNFYHSTIREDVLFGRLMSEEAGSLGIVVSDEMVNAFINRSTADKLSGEAFGKARKSLMYQGAPVRSDALFDILREQIRSQIAFNTLAPDSSVAQPSPEVYWEYFQRLNVRQQVEVAELDVDAFLDQVPDPTDAEVEQLFASAAAKLPNAEEPGSPGFILPGRARIAWLEVDYDTVESTIPAVTDEEVEAFYQENRDVKYRTVVVPDKSEDKPTEQPEADQSDEPAPADEPAESESEPADSSEGETNEESKASAEETPEPTETPEPATESADESSATDESETTGDEASDGDSSGGAQFSIDDPEGAADEQPADEQPADESPAGDDETTADTPAEPKLPLIIPAETEENAGESDPQIELEFEYRELDDELRDEIREQLLQDRVRESMEEKMTAALKFMESLRTEMSQRRAEIVKQDPQKFLDDPDAANLDLRKKMAEYTPETLEQMKSYADENGLIYAVTPLVTGQEFNNEDDYPLGVAVDPSIPRFRAQGSSSVAFSVFTRFSDDDVAANDTQLFMPARAVYEPLVDEGTESQYTYWVVEFVEPHIPLITEPGVRDNVVEAFKQAKARVLVAGGVNDEGEEIDGRASELANKVRAGLAKEGEEQMSMAATLESESITGEEGSATLTVRKSQPFSWLRQSQAAANSFQQRPRVEQSLIRFQDGMSTLPGVGQDFMKTIFEEMQDEEVAVVPNYDHSSYCIVHVTNRFPTAEQGMEGLYERFARDGQMNFRGSPLTQLMRGEIVSPAIIEWEKAVWLKYGVDPDADPGQS